MYTVKKLENGIKVIMHQIPYLKSATIGIIVNSGSFFEDKENNGVSHFIEHMLFKGTKRRTAREIAEAMDDIGGQVNAFTSKEHTCFYGKVIDEHLPIAIDVLGDMITNSTFNENEIQKEKGVIIEEINMYKDFPEDLVFEMLTEQTYRDISLAYPILGTTDSVNTFNRDIIYSYFIKKYVPEDMVVSVVGSFSEEQVIELLNKELGTFNRNSKGDENIPSYDFDAGRSIMGLYKDIEQLNIAMGFQGPSTYSDDIFPMMIVNNILGGTISSRLFQEIRENRGLVYTIESSLTSYNGAGMLSIYAGLTKDNLHSVSELIKYEINQLKKNLISAKELEKSKEHLKGSYILSLEGTFSKMYEMGKNLLHGRPIETPEIVLEHINNIRMDDIERVVQKYLLWNQMNIAYVGPVKNVDKLNEELKSIFE
ncbi:M16 family metallopeptidase [Gudongella sp. SC589]|jgi:predicted Zn-dependent peptidase|uniref:M16 family metallopeptidase n=1 Tax=Gudongella sp. SC589 TaxID=3385990 RepID=UPI003904DB3C